MYCSNYIEKEIDFVLLDDTYKPAGYILCAGDFEKYCEHMKPYLERIRHLGFMKKMMAGSEISGYKTYAKAYPAHLNVDILEKCTGKGGGRLLMV